MPPHHRNPNPPAMPNEQFMEAMYAAFLGMATRAQNERPAEDRKHNYFCEYMRSSIPVFTNAGGPEEAEYWFESVSKHLSTMGVPDEYWVEFAAFKFEGPAGAWWKHIRRMQDVEGMTWEQFEALFNEQFFSQSYRDETAMEFMGLQQGEMTVREYEARFNELSRFAPSLIESERMKCLKFEKGLKGVIRLLVDRAVSGKTSGGPQRNNRKSRDQGQGSGGVPSGSSGSSGSGKNGPYSFKCHHCGELWHIKRNCPIRGQMSTQPQQQYRPGNQKPNNNERGKGKALGQMHTMAGGSSGAHAGNLVVEGMVPISHSFARVLFDTGATHTFVSASFVKILGLKPDDLETLMFISSPLGRVEVTSACRSCVITIGSEKLKADLIILPMNQFDVVLGMDWLSTYGAIVDCHRMRVTLTTGSGTTVTYQGGVNPVTEERLLRHSVEGRRNIACFSFLSALEGESGIVGENVEVPVVDEYADVFPDELPGLPPDQEIEFCIDLLLETALISIAPYRMALAEMKELRKQLRELAEKGFIRNITSP
ncbi:uncharacterized protein LOC112092398 [Morus notabilis]|uniref:uncharacterized protein LOC112092398 n=1 Tax=Morus notabilis TaxID=981085 RepID=UPI000CED4B36|nr:uncharacterized protein LOC112092398 [Morus notabilis]